MISGRGFTETRKEISNFSNTRHSIEKHQRKTIALQRVRISNERGSEIVEATCRLDRFQLAFGTHSLLR